MKGVCAVIVAAFLTRFLCLEECNKWGFKYC